MTAKETAEHFIVEDGDVFTLENDVMEVPRVTVGEEGTFNGTGTLVTVCDWLTGEIAETITLYCVYGSFDAFAVSGHTVAVLLPQRHGTTIDLRRRPLGGTEWTVLGTGLTEDLYRDSGLTPNRQYEYAYKYSDSQEWSDPNIAWLTVGYERLVICSDRFVYRDGTSVYTVLYSDVYIGVGILTSQVPGPWSVILSDNYVGYAVIQSDVFVQTDSGTRTFITLYRDDYMKIAKNQTPTFAARISRPSGHIIDPAEITAIQYTIFRKEYSPIGYRSLPVSHFTAVNLAKGAGEETFSELLERPVADIFWEGLQTEEGWLDPEETESEDTSQIRGYNFKHTPDTTVYRAFAEEGEYLVQYTLTPTEGNPIVLSWKVAVEG